MLHVLGEDKMALSNCTEILLGTLCSILSLAHLISHSALNHIARVNRPMGNLAEQILRLVSRIWE